MSSHADDNDDADDDANVIPIYDQKIFNFCGRIKMIKNCMTFRIKSTEQIISHILECPDLISH